MSKQEFNLSLGVAKGVGRRQEDRLARELVEQLLEVGVVLSVVSEDATLRSEANGAKGLEVLGPQGIALAAISLEVLRQGVRIVEVWLQTGAKRTVRLESAGEVLELTGPRSEQDQQLIQQWIDRQPSDNG